MIWYRISLIMNGMFVALVICFTTFMTSGSDFVDLESDAYASDDFAEA